MRASSVDKIIIETLSGVQTHLTSLQVFEKIRERLPAVNQSTVYRALERLVRNGKVSISDMGTGSTMYELMSDKIHHHLVCLQCGTIQTIGHEDVENLFKTLRKKYDFDILTNHLILFGTCKTCGGKIEKDGGNS